MKHSEKKTLVDNCRTLGNKDLLDKHLIALFCSAKCPGSIILKTYEYMKQLQTESTAVISGFHSPIERECLNILLKSKIPVILCPARSLERMRIKKEYQALLKNGRMLIISPFDGKHNRISSERSARRNHFISELADEIFIPYAAPGSKTEKLCFRVLESDKNVFSLDDSYNANLFLRGVKAISKKN